MTVAPIASAPGPIWQETLNESGSIYVNSTSGKAAFISSQKIFASSSFWVCAMASVIFPDADYKFYFDASAEIRAKRRHEEHPDGPDYQSVLDEINKRDERDRNKAVGALKIADGAIYIDTTYLTIKQVCEKVLEAMNS